METEPNTHEEIAFYTLPFEEMPENFQAVYTYWNALRADRFAPTWKEFEMIKIPSELLPSTLVKDIERNPLAFRYRYYGSHFVRLWEKEMTGKTTDELDSVVLAKAVRGVLETFIEQKKPTFSMLQFTALSGSRRLSLHLRLPISDDGTDVTNIVTVIHHFADKDRFATLKT